MAVFQRFETICPESAFVRVLYIPFLKGGIFVEIPETVRQLFASGPNAQLTTLSANGSPQVTVVWVGIEDNEFVMAHRGVWQKVKNVRRDPRVALSCLGRGKTPRGLQEYLVVYGEARVEEGDAAGLLQQLAQIYIGPGAEFGAPPDLEAGPSGYITRITPKRFSGVGPWNP